MKKDTVCLSSKTIEIAENETYLELTNRVCYYDAPNLNDAMLPSNNAEEKAQTLVNMPVVARYRVNSKGEPTFGSHEMYVDEDGEVAFATDNIGTHIEVYIEEDSVDVNGTQMKLPCLFAKYRVWKRNKNVIAAIRRLYSEGKLYSSWEIATSAYEFKDGIRKITDYVFLSNCLLGYEYSSPAFGKDAKAISLSTNDCQLLVAEALSQDILESSNIENLKEKEDDNLKKEKKMVDSQQISSVNTEIEITNTSNVSEEASADSVEKSMEVVETSALTEWDLRSKIEEVCRKVLDDWCWVAFHFPADKTVWVEKCGRESELDYILFTYEANGDEVSVSEPQDVKLTVSIPNINTTVENIKSEIDAKNDAIIKASEEIQTLKTQVSELTPFKEKFEKAEQERIENEIAENKKNLVSRFEKTGLITKEEFETSEEIKGYIDSLDEKSLKELVATRYMESLEEQNIETSEADTAHLGIKVESASANLNDDETTDYKSIIKNYLN